MKSRCTVETAAQARKSAKAQAESVWFMYCMGKAPSEISVYHDLPMKKVQEIVNKGLQMQQKQQNKQFV